jgi:hypothetical protein
MSPLRTHSGRRRCYTRVVGDRRKEEFLEEDQAPLTKQATSLYLYTAQRGIIEQVSARCVSQMCTIRITSRIRTLFTPTQSLGLREL